MEWRLIRGIKMRNLLVALIAFAATCPPLMAQYNYHLLLFLPWGDMGNEAGFRKSPGGQFGPMSFVIDDENGDIILLDSQNRSIKVFSRDGTQVLRNIAINSQFTDDIIWEGEQHYYLLDANVVTEYRNGNAINSYRTESPYSAISSIGSDSEGNPFFVIKGAYTLKPDTVTRDKTIRQDGIPLTNSDNMLRVIRRSSDRASVIINSETAFEIEQKNLGTVRHLGSTLGNYHYIYYETIEQQVPLRVSRYIDLIDGDGIIKVRFEVPTLAYTYIFREFFVDRGGSLYKMISTKDGITIVAWVLEPDAEFPDTMIQYPVPDKFIVPDHYNQLEEPEPDLKKPDIKDGSYEYPTVTPGEALATADSYVQHAYTVTAANITDGRILDPNGVEVETPEWVHPGILSPVVYQWGGFFTLEGFEAGLANGMYAGDKATTGVSAYAVGVDCSGFVSRCWKLPYHFSTRMMDDEITIAYGSWEEIGPGDAIHKPGHVRLLVEKNPDGSLLAVESAGYNWRVWYRNYTLSDLITYTPRYYINMEGTPGNFPRRPELRYVTAGEHSTVSWKDLSSSDAFGIRIYMSDSSEVWEDLLNGDLLSIDSNNIDFDSVEGSPFFFRLHTISAQDSVTESLPSDCYGFHSGTDPARILIVDGFDRYGGSGSYPYPYHSFAKTLGLAIAHYDFSFDTADNDAVINGTIALSDYDVVCWSLGDESTADETFSNIEQDLVVEYLQQGGRLFVSGSEIAWDLDHMGSESDKAFIHDYLKATYDEDDSESYRVTGTAGSVFEHLDIHFDDGSHGVYEEDYPDVYRANGSEAALLYENGQIAALKFKGHVPDGEQDASIMIMGFPFETIYDENERTELIGRVLQFFGYYIADPLAEHQPPDSYSLHQNFPNPFNPYTAIRYEIPKRAQMALVIYNILGQRVVTVEEGVVEPGCDEYIWNGRDNYGREIASGIYIARLVTPGYAKSIKMLLLK